MRIRTAKMFLIFEIFNEPKKKSVALLSQLHSFSISDFLQHLFKCNQIKSALIRTIIYILKVTTN